MDFPAVTNLVAAGFSEINSRGGAATGPPGDAAQPIASEGGMGAGSESSSSFGNDDSNPAGRHLNTTA